VRDDESRILALTLKKHVAWFSGGASGLRALKMLALKLLGQEDGGWVKRSVVVVAPQLSSTGTTVYVAQRTSLYKAL